MKGSNTIYSTFEGMEVEGMAQESRHRKASNTNLQQDQAKKEQK